MWRDLVEAEECFCSIFTDSDIVGKLMKQHRKRDDFEWILTAFRAKAETFLFGPDMRTSEIFFQKRQSLVPYQNMKPIFLVQTVFS